MDSSTDISARIDRLEGSSRRDRLLGVAVLALVFATAQAPGPPPATATTAPIVVSDATGATATLTARGLTVRDPAGRVRSFVGVDDANRPSVDLSDTTGVLRESMYLLNEFPVLRQFDGAGKRRVDLHLDSASNGELQFSDANEKLRLALFRTKGGDPQMGLYGTDEKLRAYFSTDDASPYLVMRDNAGTNRVYAGGYQDGSVGIAVRSAANVVQWKAP